MSHQVREVLVGYYLGPLTDLMKGLERNNMVTMWKIDHHRGRGEVAWEEGGLHVQVGGDGDSDSGHSRENSQK